MAASIETKRRLRAIRRLSASFPDRTAEERLEKIEGIASGKLEPTVARHGPSSNLMERLAAGQASRSPRISDARRAKDAAARKAEEGEAEEKKRKRGRRGGRDRMERDGLNRSSDLNL